MLKVRGAYHAFTKNESTRYLEHATATSLTGPWTFVGTGNWSGFGAGMEGPCVVQLDDGTWRIFVDSQVRPVTARFLTATSPDLVTWSAPVVLPGWGSLRHGTVIRDTSVVLSLGDGGTSQDGGSADSGDGTVSRGLDATSADASDDAMAEAMGPDGGDDATVQPGEAGPPEQPETGAAPSADALVDSGPAAPPAAGGCSCHAAEAPPGRAMGSASFSLLALAWLRRKRGRAGPISTGDR